MDKLSELTQATVDALFRDYMLWVCIASLALAFALYVYFFPQSIDFFENPPTDDEKVKNDNKE